MPLDLDHISTMDVDHLGQSQDSQGQGGKNGTHNVRNADETDATASTSAVSASDTSEISQQVVKKRAPSPPRWRFVKEARKSSGYSTRSAGSFVKGKSSEELGAKYIPPEIAYQERITKRESVGELSIPGIRYSQFEKDLDEVGELSTPDIKYSEFKKGQNEVGKLSINESTPGNEELYEGGCVITHDPKHEVHPEKHSRIWANYQPRTKYTKETKAYEKDKWTNIIEDENIPQRKYKAVGRLQFCPDDFLDEPFEGEIPRRKLDEVITSTLPTSNELEGNQNGERPDGSVGHPEDGSGDGEGDGNDDTSSKDMRKIVTAEEPRRRRKWWHFLLLIPLIIAGSIVGVVLGKRDLSPDAGDAVVIAAVIMLSNDTAQPSTVPSAPSQFESSSFGGLFQEGRPVIPSTTTSHPSSFPSAIPPHFEPHGLFYRPIEPTPSPTSAENLVSIFDMSTPYPTAMPVEYPSSESPSVNPSELQTLIPSRQPSEEPSQTPTLSTSGRPSEMPSEGPSISPSDRPVTAFPTSQLIVFLGGCPETYVPVSYYGIGKQVELQGIVYQCISFSCGSFGMELGSPSGLWREGWEIVGSCSGSLAPVTTSPTPLPTQEPSVKPSSKPSRLPSKAPMATPVTSTPSNQPTHIPSKQPIRITGSPSRQPSAKPVTDSPTRQPVRITASPSKKPSQNPVTGNPTKQPIRITGSPSKGPIWQPSNKPTMQPSTAPSQDLSKPPTSTPTKSIPTKQPILFLGGCPNVFIPLTNYTVGSKVSSNGIVYECLSYPCETSGFFPYPSSGTLKEGWQVVGSCSGTLSPTRQPSQSPTTSPSPDPSTSPTKNPTTSPSKNPSTSPSKSPSSLPTASPSGTPTTSPSNGPSSSPSTSPSKTPTTSPSKSPSSSPSNARSRQPSKNPTSKPTVMPSQKPTVAPEPTSSPTCSENGNFNLCFAIDMSGSVCNGDTNSLCTECEPLEYCNSGGEKKTVCCPNFSNVLQFTKNLVTSLGELPTEQDFSIVHFGTDVTVASTLESWRQSVKTINRLIYTGGKTNLAAAIDSCQQTLANSPPDRTNLLLIITDGAPSVPAFNAMGWAKTAADNAKIQDTFIIPVLIEESYWQFAPEKLFLENDISSDGKLFVANFEGLVNLQDSLFEQVTCQA